MINLYLGSDKQAQITALAKNPESSLRGYVYEALRELTHQIVTFGRWMLMWFFRN